VHFRYHSDCYIKYSFTLCFLFQTIQLIYICPSIWKDGPVSDLNLVADSMPPKQQQHIKPTVPVNQSKQVANTVSVNQSKQAPSTSKPTAVKTNAADKGNGNHT